MSIRRQFTVWIITGLIMCGAVYGHTRGGDPLHQADSLFLAREYDAALAIWHDEARRGGDRASLAFNIGLAEWRSGRMGAAMLALEKARRLKPLDRSIRQAWSQARQDMVRPVVPVDPFWPRTIFAALTALRPGNWAMAGMGLLALALWGWYAVKIKRVSNSRLISRGILAAGLIGGICLLFAGLSFRALFRADEAVVQKPCILHEAASAQSPVGRTVAEGEHCVLLDSVGEWKRVRLLNRDEGWMADSCLQTIILIPRP